MLQLYESGEANEGSGFPDPLRHAGVMPDRSDNRAEGRPDLNVKAYETLLTATGQIEKPTPEPQKKPRGVSLRPSETREEEVVSSRPGVRFGAFPFPSERVPYTATPRSIRSSGARSLGLGHLAPQQWL